jgi:hypothetical protein
MAGSRSLAVLALGLSSLLLSGCFLRKWVYHPVPVANAIGDSTTQLAGTRVHVFNGEQYELYGPTTASVASAVPQINRAYREFAKHFGVEAPRIAVVLADSAFAISPLDAGAFAQRRLHTFVYVRPHNLRDIEGVPPDTREEEIWPIGARTARELLAAFVSSRRRGAAPEVETTTHGPDHHVGGFPLWYVDAVVALLSDAGAPDRVMEYLRDHLSDAPPLEQILTMRSPNGGADSVAMSRDRRTLVGATGVAFILFAVEREGPRIVGRIGDSFLNGGTARDALHDAKRLAQTDRELDRMWRVWIRDEYGR